MLNRAVHLLSRFHIPAWLYSLVKLIILFGFCWLAYVLFHGVFTRELAAYRGAHDHRVQA